MTIRVGIIGCGLIGQRRAAAAAEHPGCDLVAVADADITRASTLANRLGVMACPDGDALLRRDDLDGVAVCTFNKHLAPLAIEALGRNLHVLTEKPPGRNGAEAREMAVAARSSRRVLKVGFNLRFHPAIARLYQLHTDGALGPAFYLRAIYGHGGRPGYAAEWRGDPDLAGGGELLDQGVHVLDLATWLLGDLSVVGGALGQFFWEMGPLEDNALGLLRSSAGQLVSLHTSWTQWRNRFDFEVTYRDGFARVSGLGGSYGVETLVVGHRRPGEAPEEVAETFPGDDASWRLDWDDFVAACNGERAPAAGAEQAVRVMSLVDDIYRMSRA